MPVGEHRATLELRREELRASMQPCDPRVLVARVSRFFLRFPASSKSESAEGTAAAYATDLSKFPLWAVDAGMLSVINASGHSAQQFVPSSPVLQDAVRKATFSIIDEIRELSNVLDADVYHENTPEERARMNAEFQKIMDELGWNKPYLRSRRPDARDPRPEPPKCAIKPPPLSDEALALFRARQPAPSFVEGE